MIKLEDFVSETLRQILNGIVKAQENAKELGGEVNPSTANYRTDQGMQLYDYRDGSLIEHVNFDVVVTTSEGTETKGGIGVFVGPIGLGSHGYSNATNQSISNIKFTVPVKFPSQKKEIAKITP